MYQPAAMRVVKPFGGLRNDRCRCRIRNRTVTANKLSQIGAGHVLGDEEIRVPLVVGIRNANEVWMVKLRLRANLALERSYGVWRALALRQHFDRFDATQE